MIRLAAIPFLFALFASVLAAQTLTTTDSLFNTGIAASGNYNATSHTTGVNTVIHPTAAPSNSLWLMYTDPFGITSGSGTITQAYSGSGSVATTMSLTGLPGGGVDAYPFLLYGCDPYSDCYQNQPPQFQAQLSAFSAINIDVNYALTGTITGKDVDLLFDEWVCNSNHPTDSSQCLEVEVLPYYSFTEFGGGTFVKEFTIPATINGSSSSISFDEYNGGGNMLFYPHGAPGSVGTASQELAFNILSLLNEGVTTFGNSSYKYVAGIELGTEMGASSSQSYTLTLTKNLIQEVPAGSATPGWTGVIAPSRAVDWSQAGISGGIPSATKCGSTIAAYGSSGSPASPSTIITALQSCGANGIAGPVQYVLLGAGDFYLNGAIYLQGASYNNVELRGSGPSQTRLHFSAASTCQNGNGTCFVGFATTSGNYVGSPGTVANWTAGYAQGATSITVSNGAAITAGTTMLVLDQCDTGFTGAPCTGSAVDNGNLFNCEAGISWSGTPYASSYTGCSYTGPVGAGRPNRGQQEIVQAVSCSPACGTAGTTTVTISPPLKHPNWASGQTPQMWTIPAQYNVGVRNLTIEGANLTYPNPTAGIGFAGTLNYWVDNVVFNSLSNISLFVTQGAAHGEIESNYIYFAGQGPTNDSSGINLLGSSNLVDNNICHNSLLCYVGNGPQSGSVIAYNYFVNADTANSTLYESFDDGHSNGIDYNLYEGNVGTLVSMDQAHGTHLVNTFYRNFFAGWESCSNGNCGSNTEKTDNLFALGPVSNHRYGNYVANVLGTPGVTTGYYNYFGNSSGPVNPSEWYLGSGGVGNIWDIGSGNTVSPPSYDGPIPYDPIVAETIYRWGNWDAKNGSTQWNTAEVPTSPPSGVLAQTVPTTTCTSSLTCPPSFYRSSAPSWWGSNPWPAIGPDISGGNIGQCNGTLNTAGHYSGLAAFTSSQCTGTSLAAAWGGHVNAIPAQKCAQSVGINVDGTSGFASTFDAAVCYAAGPPALGAPTYNYGTGNYLVLPTVTISAAAGAIICWTTDGSTPGATTPGTCSHGTQYSGPVGIAVSGATLKSIATESGFVNSSETDATYTKTPMVLNSHSVFNGGASAFSSVSTTITPKLGDGVVCGLVYGGTATITSVSDNVNAGAYSAAIAASYNSSVGATIAQYYKSNVAAGSTTVTLALSASSAYVALACEDWQPGTAGSFNLDASFVQQQVTLPSTANPTTGTAKTPGFANELVMGNLLSNEQAPTAGTNFTLVDTAPIPALFPEYWIQTTPTSTNAPYTMSADVWTDQMSGFYFSSGAPAAPTNVSVIVP